MTDEVKAECLAAADRLHDLGFVQAAVELKGLTDTPKCWHLTPADDWPAPIFATVVAVVVVAHTEQAAREMASEQCGNEGSQVWLDPSLTRCVEVGARERVVLVDFRAE